MTERKFTCARCRREFISAWTQEEAEEEFKTVFGHVDYKDQPRHVYCHACYLEYMEWHKNTVLKFNPN